MLCCYGDVLSIAALDRYLLRAAGVRRPSRGFEITVRITNRTHEHLCVELGLRVTARDVDAIPDRRGEPVRRQRARGWHVQVTRLEAPGGRSVKRTVDPVLASTALVGRLLYP